MVLDTLLLVFDWFTSFTWIFGCLARMLFGHDLAFRVPHHPLQDAVWVGFGFFRVLDCVPAFADEGACV